MTHSIEEIIKTHFPILNEEGLINEIEEFGTIVSKKANSVLIEIGSYIKQMPLLVKGTLKISREGNDENELLLYYLTGGDTCAMSLTCFMGEAKSNIRATVLEDTEIIMLPTSKIDEWMMKYSSWKTFVVMAYQKRFDELLQTIDSIAFLKMDERLEKYLADRSKELDNKIISITHQDIANDLHTSREVISRLLKQLEKLGRIKLHRYKVEIISLM